MNFYTKHSTIKIVQVEKKTGMKQNANKIVPQLNDNLAFQIDNTANYNKSFRREFTTFAPRYFAIRISKNSFQREGTYRQNPQ